MARVANIELDVYLEKLHSEISQRVFEELVLDINPKRESDFAALVIKVANAEREIKRARQYPIEWSDDQIADDMERFYSNLYELAMYDFNIRGAEGQSQVNENGENRMWVDRRRCLNGVTPIAVIA